MWYFVCVSANALPDLGTVCKGYSLKFAAEQDPSGVKYRKGDRVATALSRHGDDSSVNVTPHGVAPSSLHVCPFWALVRVSYSSPSQLELANKASYRQLWGLLLQPPVGS